VFSLRQSDGVNRPEFLEQPSGTAKFAEDRSVQAHPVYLAGAIDIELRQRTGECASQGAIPSSCFNSNRWNDIDSAGEIYRMRLDGTVLGKFGRAGRLLKEFGAVNSIDCRSENTLFVGELANLRVQKLCSIKRDPL